jgi:predicted DNA-binding protein with PD1-like motif
MISRSAAGSVGQSVCTDGNLPHIHTSVGLKEHSATAHTSHLLAAQVQFLTEMIIVEIDAPEMIPTP